MIGKRQLKFEQEKINLKKEILSKIKVEEIVEAFNLTKINKYYSDIITFEDYLKEFKPKITQNKKLKVISHYNYQLVKKSKSDSYGHVAGYKAHEILEITEKEFKKLVSNSLIQPTGYTEFRKWGKVLKAPYYNYDYLHNLKGNKLEKILAQNEGFNSVNHKAIWKSIVKELESKFSVRYINDYWYMDISLKKIKTSVLDKVYIQINKDNYMNFKMEEICILFKKEIRRKKERESLLNSKIDNIFNTHLINEEELELLKDEKYKLNDIVFKSSLFEKINFFIEDINYKRDFNKTINELDLKNYQNSFEIARNIRRNVNFIVGPTNSGKTFEALSSLMKSNSGVYLAPLRLMALEIYEKLNEAGVACNLITGEEEIIVEGAMHTSSTIECINLSNIVECAIIDEIQMINDEQRGWAWTQALLGVPAQKVYVIGNESALEKSVDLISRMKESSNVSYKNRLSSLTVLNEYCCLEGLKKGDALIAFSKKQVLRYASSLRKMGKKVSVIYGALSPEVRKKQANLFNTGVNDVLVSTDAIGMGLNLPIDRIIFSTLNKYDGYENRKLNSTEIKQIAGRAGRYNSNGFVCILDDYIEKDGNRYIKKSLKLADSNITKFPIVPNKWHISKIKEILNTNSINKILRLFPTFCYSNDFYSINNENVLQIANYIDNKIDIDATEKLKFCLTPIDTNSENQWSFFCQVFNTVFLSNKIMNFPIFKNVKDDFSFNDLQNAEEELKYMITFKYLSKFSENIILDGLEERKMFLENFILRALLKVKVPEHKVYVDNFFNDLYY